MHQVTNRPSFASSPESESAVLMAYLSAGQSARCYHCAALVLLLAASAAWHCSAQFPGVGWPIDASFLFGLELRMFFAVGTRLYEFDVNLQRAVSNISLVEFQPGLPLQ